MTPTTPAVATPAGIAMWRLAPFLGLLLAGTALVAGALVPAGLWRGAVVWPVLAVVAALAWRGASLVPLRPVPAGAAWACVGVAAAHGSWAALTHAEHVVLRRDAGSYALYAQWIATRHRLPVDAHLSAFGGLATLADRAFTLDSPAYYQVVGDGGAHVVPQFFVGAPAWFSLGWWVGGWSGLFVMPALTSAAAVLAFAGLLARVLDARWAAVGAGVLAASQPVLHAARSTYSEPAALLLVLVAAALTVDVLSPDVRAQASSRAGTALALLAGGVLGGAGLVRVDALREVALMLPVLAVMAVRRQRGTAALTLGLAVGTLASAAVAVGLSRPYLRDISDSLVPLLALTGALALASGVLAVAGRRWAAPAASGPRAPTDGAPAPTSSAWLPRALALATAAVWVVLVTRPWWLTVVDDPDSPVSRMVDGFQRQQGLAVVPGRTYAEDSLVWVSWWLSPLVVASAALGCVGLAAAAGRWWVSRRPVPAWLPVTVVGLGSTVLTLWRPGITPDHPWADRRLVPGVLPFLVAAALVLPAAAARRVSPEASAAARTRLRWGTAAGLGFVLAWTLSATVPVALLRTERGEPAAVSRVCAQLRDGDVVLAVDPRGYHEWVQVVRGVCGVPSAAVRPPEGDSLERALARIAPAAAATGGRVVLLAAEPETDVAALPARELTRVQVRTREDERLLERRPVGWVGLRIDVRLAVWTG
ncbi:MAG: hypothetical protein U0Q15_14080 [Kineosporiaceae bacterium]